MRACLVLPVVCACGGTTPLPASTPTPVAPAVSVDAAIIAAVSPDAQVASTTCLPQRGRLVVGFKNFVRICADPEAQFYHRGDHDPPSCIGFDVATGSFHVETPDRPDEPDGVPSLDVVRGESLSIEVGGKRRPLGARTIEAIANAAVRHHREPRDDDHPPLFLAATTNGAAVVVDDGAWSVARDRKLVLAPPPKALKENPTPLSMAPVGDFLYVEWRACAGPCGESRVFASDGRVVSDGLGGSGLEAGNIRMLDAKRWAVITEWHDLLVFELASGKLLHKISLGDANAAAYVIDGTSHKFTGTTYSKAVVMIDADRAAVVIGDDDLVSIVDVRQGKVLRHARLPRCPAPP